MKKVYLMTAIVFLFASCNNEKLYDEKMKETVQNTVMTFALSGIICDGVVKTWNTAIFEKKTPSGKYCENFEEALEEIMSFYKSNGTLDSLENYKSKMTKSASELADPPANRKECYNDILALVNDAGELCRLAQYPSGSLRSYNDRINELVKEIGKKTDQLSIKHGKYLRIKEDE